MIQENEETKRDGRVKDMKEGRKEKESGQEKGNDKRTEGRKWKWGG